MQSGCVICYDSFGINNKKNDDEVKIVATMCGHVFHNICIQEWFTRSRTCPECRRYVRKGNLTKLFINFCIENKSDAEEVLDSLTEQLSVKDLECVEKDKKITELQVNCAISERKSEEKDKLIEKLQACFANSQLEIVEKDGKIEELQTCFANSQLEIVEKDGKIEELQTCFARSELESLAKDGKIEELETCFARSELEGLEKDEKIKKLQASFDLSIRDVEKMLQQQVELTAEMSAIKQEIKHLSCIKVENQNLLKEKNTLKSEKNVLMSELEHLNEVKRIVKESPTDNEILADMKVHVITEEGKIVEDRIATYCSLLKQELSFTKEETTRLHNELTKVKQELAHSQEEKSQLSVELKLAKRRLRTPYLVSSEKVRELGEIRQLGESLKKYKCSSFSISCGRNPVPVTSSLPNKRSSRGHCSLICSPTHEGFSVCKSQSTSITEDISENKRQKISILDFVKKYSLFSTTSETSILKLDDGKIKYKGDSSGVGYKDLGNHLCLVLGDGEEPDTIRETNCVLLLN